MDDPSLVHVGHLAIWRHPSLTGVASARVLIVHGLCEHSGRHQNTINALTKGGFEVIRFDLRGAGMSGGERQWILRFQDYVEDVTNAYRWIERESQPLPLFLLGHSLGGLIAIHFAHEFQKVLKGLILSAPAYRVGGGVSPLKIRIGKWLESVTPSLRIPTSLDSGTLSRDPDVEKAYRSDPLSFHFNTIKQGNEILRALPNALSYIRQIEVPTLFVHGTLDTIIEFSGSFELFQESAARDKELLAIAGGLHEPHNDWDREYYFTHLCRWIDKRTQSLP